VSAGGAGHERGEWDFFFGAAEGRHSELTPPALTCAGECGRGWPRTFPVDVSPTVCAVVPA
jgi:hypothetical protein